MSVTSPGTSSGKQTETPAAVLPRHPGHRRHKELRLLDDPWRKLAALALAILLWMFLDGRITKETELDCLLTCIDEDRILQPEAGNSVIAVRIPFRDFTPMGFFGSDGQEITRVRLSFRGADNLISQINSGNGEKFELRAQLRPGETFFEFDLSALIGDRELKSALVGMEPRRLRLDLEPNGAKEVVLTHDKIAVIQPEPIEGVNFGDRLLQRDMTFTPATVTLRGTENGLSKIQTELEALAVLFQANLSQRADDFRGAREIRASLDATPLLKKYGVTCTPESPQVVIPLRPEWKEHQITVPVLIDAKATKHSATDFNPIEDQKILLRVAGASQLAREIEAQDGEALAEWVVDNVRLIAKIPADYTGGDALTRPHLFFPEFRDHKEGFDYEMPQPPPIIITPREE